MIARTFNNPTALAVGRAGVFEGQDAKVRGHSVLRSRDGGRWDEYHIELADRAALTLVYESGQWKRFALFEPKVSLSARDAGEVAVGDDITLGDQTAKVTYVGGSRVVYIQGSPPEGYRVGSEADYFNAVAGTDQVVVSWTGEEVEYYRGRLLPRGTVESAFGLPEPSFLSRLGAGSGGFDSWFDSGTRLASAMVAFGLFVAFFLVRENTSSERTAEPPAPVAAPSSRLAVRAQGRLGGHLYAVSGHRLVEIADPAGRFGRHEYDLMDEQGGHALLIQALERNQRQWTLFEPLAGASPLRPVEAATFASGSRVNLAGTDAIVRELFISRTVAVDGDPPPGEHLGGIRFGFVAETKGGSALARWSATDIEIYLGQGVPEAQVLDALGPLRTP